MSRVLISSKGPEQLAISDYLPLVANRGHFVIVGISCCPHLQSFKVSQPHFDQNQGSRALLTISHKGNLKVAGSMIGSPGRIKEMLDFVVQKNIQPWIQKYDMANTNTAMPDFEAGKARYRIVLVNKVQGAKM